MTFSRLSRKLLSSKNATANCMTGGRRPCCFWLSSAHQGRYEFSSKLHRRSFVSFPNPLDARRSMVVVPKVPTAAPTAATLPSCSMHDEALAFAAEEAERLLAQVGKRKEYYKSKKRTDDYDEKLRGNNSAVGEDEVVQQEVIEGVNTLLIVSNNNSLEDLVMQNKTKKNSNTVRIASLHRAFIALTTRCLDCVQIIASQVDETSDKEERLQALLDPALALARRAHDLGFPFHLPLYQRLMGAVATTPAKTATIPATILEIAAFITDTLDAPIDCTLFQPSLLALLKAEKFPQVVEILHAMRDRHGITSFDPQSVFDLYTQTHEVLRKSLFGDGKTLASRRQLPEDAVTEIAVILEPSVLNLSSEIERRFDEVEDNIKKAINDAVDELGAEEAESMMTQIEQEEQEEENENQALETRQSSNDPLDQIITAIITKRVTDETAKNLFADMIKYGRIMKHGRTRLSLSNSSDSKASPATATIPAVIEVSAEPVKESEIEEVDYWADSSSESDDEEQKLAPPNREREQLLLPDVTEQVVQLNKGRALKFTKRYRELMWIRDAEQDSDEAEDNEIAYSTSYGTSDADTDVTSDDDDSGEDY